MIQHLLLKKSLRKIYVLQHKSHSGCAAGYRLVQLRCRSGVRGYMVIWLYGWYGDSHKKAAKRRHSREPQVSGAQLGVTPSPHPTAA